MATTFTDFRDGLGGDVCGRIGFDASTATGWRNFTARLREHDGSSGRLLAAAEEFSGVCSSGERIVLAAVLASGGWNQDADRICPGFWQRTLGSGMGEDVCRAVAAVLLRQDA